MAEENNQSLAVQQPTNELPTINFSSGSAPANMITPASEPTPQVGKKAGDLVERAFEQAVVTQVVNNADVQNELLKSAEQVVHSKTSAIKSQAELEDKAIHFNNKKGACECFGYNEATTEKWAVTYMNVWHNIMTAIWVTIGMITFAPITFVAKKIKVIFKASWVAILLAVLIYFIVLFSPFWGKFAGQWVSDFFKQEDEAPPAADEQVVDPVTDPVVDPIPEVTDPVAYYVF